MANPHAVIAPGDTPIHVYDGTRFPTYQTTFSTKEDFITNVVNPAITSCPKLALIWREVLQEPLTLGYIPWNNMIILIASLHKHDTTNHPCTSSRVVYDFIIESLLLCRIIHYPPFPGGAEGDRPFYAVTRVKMWEHYKHFNQKIFSRMDMRAGFRPFDSIRDTPVYMDKNLLLPYATRVYHTLEEQGILPPAFNDPELGVPHNL